MERIERHYTENELATTVIGRAIDVHRTLGPGLLESAYQECLFYEPLESGLVVEREKPMPITYKSVQLEHGYRLDLLVEDKLVIELKTVDIILAVHEAQLLTYLKLGGYRLGLLINFRVPLLRDGISRLANFAM